jgi:cytochrome c oxidase cbb3-type subunit 1
MQVWGALLVTTGVLQFLAPPLAALKFTHGLVAHAHLAMAGFASSYAGLLLRLGEPARGGAVAESTTFWLWQGGTAAHVVALAAIGALEAADPAFVLRGGAALDALFAWRWLAGLTMLIAAWRWFAAGRGRAR